MKPVEVTLPTRAVNTSNSREHWGRIAARAKFQRQWALMVLRSAFRKSQPADGALDVTLTRVAPRALDDDGNVTSLKAVRDGVADALGLRNDRDPRVTWLYGQRRGAVREYAVEVRIEART